MAVFEQAFVLHVELICPDGAAADRVLAGLQQCSEVTEMAGPGVPTYLFYRSQPISQHARARARNAVGLEYYELYLDAAAFWQHSASPEFLERVKAVINPADRLDRQIYVVGRPATEVTNTKIWAQLQAQPLPERHSNIFDSECSATRPECEYVSLFIERVPARVDVSLFEIATDPSWISVLAFAHPVFRSVTRLLGVRVVAPFRSPHAWSTLADQATRINGTHIGPSAAPLHAHLSANPHTSIVRLGEL